MDAKMTVREVLVVFIGAVLVACVLFWPLPLHLSTTVAHDAGDPLLQAWQLAWDGHALIHQPLDFWQANLFYPEKDSLAFSDALIGYTPAGLIGSGPAAALARYNVLFLLVYAMSVAGPYVLGRELGLHRGAAFVCGLAFAYSPWRWAQSGHLHILSSGTIALAIALLLRGYRRGSPRSVFLGWAVVAWQVLIGVSLGLLLLYLLVALTLVAAVVWWRAGHPVPSRRVLIASGAGIGTVLVVLALVAPAYLRVQSDHPEAKRDLATLQVFSPPARSFLIAPENNTVWGAATADRRATIVAPDEQTLFPGVATMLLALLGLLTAVFSIRLRTGLLVAVLLAFLFSMGVAFEDGRFTYRLLYDHLPGFESIRTPGRLHTFTTLGLALLAGAGAQWLSLRRRGAALAVCALLAVPVLAEGSNLRTTVKDGGTFGYALHPTPRLPPAGLGAAKPPLIQLPPDDPLRYQYMLWSTDGFPRMVNGLSGFEPTTILHLKDAAQFFPNQPSVDAFRAAGIRTVVAHPNDMAGTPWTDIATRPIGGLGITRRRVGDVILFDLEP